MTFVFNTVSKLHVETGAAKRLGEIIAPRMRRPVFVTDKGVVGAGLTGAALKDLTARKLDFCLFDDTEADPPASVVKKAVESARAHGADGVIGFGGGSSMDTAKIIAALLTSDQQLEEIYGVDQITAPRAPLVLIPTTAGTGSEVTNISIVTSDDALKRGIVDDALYADIAVLDANLTLTTPRHVTAATGIDAMVHAIEAYTSKIKKNRISDALAREGLSLLSKNILRACEAPSDIAAREAMLLGAMLAGQAFSNAPVAAVHALAYPLGVHFHIPHGHANALMLTPVLQYNASTAAPLYAELGDIIGANDTGDFNTRADAFAAKMAEICADTGIELRLSALGVKQDDLPRMAEEAAQNDRLMQNNPRAVNAADALSLYTEAL